MLVGSTKLKTGASFTLLTVSEKLIWSLAPEVSVALTLTKCVPISGSSGVPVNNPV